MDARLMIGAALVSFLVGATSGWTVNGWRIGKAIEAQKAGAATQLAKATEMARNQERQNELIKTKAEVEHAKARDQIERTLADNRRLARKLGGLRDPGSRTGGDFPVSGTETASGIHPACPTGSRLSAEAEEFLLEFAAAADRAADYAHTCHDWAVSK